MPSSRLTKMKASFLCVVVCVELRLCTPDGGFPGFYSVLLPDHCWDSAGKTVLCSEAWGSLLVSGPSSTLMAVLL